MPPIKSFTAQALGPLVKNKFGLLDAQYEADIKGEPADSIHSKRRRARNVLRFLIQGNPVHRDGNYKEGLILVEKALVKEKDPSILDALRLELRAIFHNAFNILQAQNINEQDEALFQILLSNLISLYPFCDPVRLDKKGNPLPLETFSIPQKIDGHWVMVNYLPQRLDISPKQGILSYHNSADKIFAYGLYPRKQQNAKAWLAFRGTPPPTLPGARFADLFNFKPLNSIGEGHNTQAVDAFIAKAQSKNIKVNTCGHSQGATLALLAGMRHPGAIEAVHALNPAPLSSSTLRRLNAKWKAYNEQAEGKKAILNVYAQEGDPAVFLGDGFPEGTRYFHLYPKEKLCSDYKKLVPQYLQKHIEAHIRFFAGQNEVQVQEEVLEKINKSLWREFFSDLKSLINLIVFPIDYLTLALEISTAKVDSFLSQHQKKIQLAFAISFTGLALALCALVPGFIFTFPVLPCIILSITLLASELVQVLNKALKNVITGILSAIQAVLLLSFLPLVALGSGIKILGKTLFFKILSNNEVLAEENKPFAKEKMLPGAIDHYSVVGSKLLNSYFLFNPKSLNHKENLADFTEHTPKIV